MSFTIQGGMMRTFKGQFTRSSIHRIGLLFVPALLLAAGLPMQAGAVTTKTAAKTGSWGNTGVWNPYPNGSGYQAKWSNAYTVTLNSEVSVGSLLFNAGGAVVNGTGKITIYGDDGTGATAVSGSFGGGAVSIACNVGLGRDNLLWNFSSSSASGLTVSGVISDNGGSGLEKAGNGTLTLSAANAYSGLTKISAGTLAYGINNAIGDGAVTVNGATAVLNVGAYSDTVGAVTLTAGSITGSGGILTSTSGFTMNNASAATVSAILGGSVGLTKSEAGALTLSAENTYSGTTAINGGTLILDSTGSLHANPAVTISGGATFDVSAIADYTALNSGALSTVSPGSGAAVIKGGTTVDLGSQPFTLTYAPASSGGDLLNPALSVSSGALTLNGNTITITGSGLLGPGDYRVIAGTVSATGTLIPNVVGFTMGGSASLVADGSGVTLTIVDDRQPLKWAVGNGVWDSATVDNWKQANGTPTQYLAEDVVVFEDSLSGASPITVTLDADVAPQGVTVNNSTKDYTLAGPGGISGTTALAKSGTGTLTLSGPNTYSGTTIIGAGTLVLGASGSIGSSAGITIAVGAVLDVTAKTTLGSQAYTIEIDPTGAGSTGLINAADLDISNANLALDLSGTLDDEVYILATYTGTLTGLFASPTGKPSNYHFNYNYTGNGLKQIALVATHGGPWAVTSPKTRAIYQRDNSNTGHIVISGSCPDSVERIEVRATRRTGYRGTDTSWVTLVSNPGTSFSGSFAVDGGWYDVEIRAIEGGVATSTTTVARVGAGDLFITAGQSNIGNYGAALQTALDDCVNTLNEGTMAWQHAVDPQPNATSSSGSMHPGFGDQLSARSGVPVGFISTAVGGSSVADWVPGTGANYTRLQTAIANFLSYGGIRSILWHQGEQDGRNGTDAATYQSRLNSIIAQSRIDAGTDVPWGVALVSYYPGSSAMNMANIIAGQQLVINNTANVFKGSETDNYHLWNWMNSDNIHFSDTGLKDHGRQWAEAVWARMALTGQGSNLVWSPVANGNWGMGTVNNWLNTDLSSQADFSAFSSVAFTDSGAGFNTVTLTSVVVPSVVEVNSGIDYVFMGSGYISGTGTLTKAGSGMLTINSANNNYTGGTLINAGTIQLNSGQGTRCLGGDIVINSGGTLWLPNYNQLGASNNRNSPNNTVTLNSGSISWTNTVETFNNLTLNNATLVLNGGFNPNWGALNIYGTLTAVGTSAVMAGINTDNIMSPGSASGAKTLTLMTSTSEDSLSIQVVIKNYDASNTYSLDKEGAGVAVLGGVNTYTGTTTINAGTLKLDAGGSIGGSSGIVINPGGVLDVTAKTTLGSQSYTLGVDPAGSGAAGRITAANLDIGSAHVILTGTPDDPVYVLATYSGDLTGDSFASVAGLPSGYHLNYNYTGNGLKQIALEADVAATATKLSFKTQPSATVIGGAITVEVYLKDADNNTVLGQAKDVTVAIKTGAGTLSGTKTVAVNTGTGVATFSGLSLDVADTYTLTATAESLTSADSDSFVVSRLLVTGGVPAYFDGTGMSIGGTTIPGSGTYNLADYMPEGGIATAGDFNVCRDDGPATLNQSADTLVVSSFNPWLGMNGAGYGTYNMSGTAVFDSSGGDYFFIQTGEWNLSGSAMATVRGMELGGNVSLSGAATLVVLDGNSRLLQINSGHYITFASKCNARLTVAGYGESDFSQLVTDGKIRLNGNAVSGVDFSKIFRMSGSTLSLIPEGGSVYSVR